jgi:Protein of unknown function (DUF2950)
MLQLKINRETMRWSTSGTMTALAFALTVSALAKDDQQTFRTPSEAAEALVSAAAKNDQQALRQILGSDSQSILDSGDEAEDRESRATFLRKYEEMHRFVKEPDGTTALYIGAENWPAPIPLVNRGGSWFFDADAGKKEILYRRVGANELEAIEVCHELVSAQEEYYKNTAAGSVNQYAQKFVSNDNTHNALHWQGNGSENESPIGPLLARAGMAVSGAPFYGYYYRMLTSQGKHARGGAKSYLVDGKMTGGFAFVAFPAEYKSSGVMTFVVDKYGVVYEKDLGPQTVEIVQAMKEYNPDSNWRRSE